jgi:hypothetical protein
MLNERLQEKLLEVADRLSRLDLNAEALKPGPIAVS